MLLTQISGKENPKKTTAVLKWPEANSMFSQPGSCKTWGFPGNIPFNTQDELIR